MPNRFLSVQSCVRVMSQNNRSSVPAKPSATIVIVRESSSGTELLLVRRRAGDAFGDNYAFPGGVVDDDESLSHAYSQGRTIDEANAILGVENGGLDYYSAAIRELFEETGILLARDSTGDWFRSDPTVDGLRKDVDQGALPWSDFFRYRLHPESRTWSCRLTKPCQARSVQSLATFLFSPSPAFR